MDGRGALGEDGDEGEEEGQGEGAWMETTSVLKSMRAPASSASLCRRRTRSSRYGVRQSASVVVGEHGRAREGSGWDVRG